MTCQNTIPVKNRTIRAQSNYIFAFKGSKSISELAETKI